MPATLLGLGLVHLMGLLREAPCSSCMFDQVSFPLQECLSSACLVATSSANSALSLW